MVRGLEALFSTRGQTVLAACVALGLFALRQVSPYAFALIVVAALTGIVLTLVFRAVLGDSVDPERRAWLGQLTLLAFVGHILVSTIISSTYQLVQTLGPDAITYHGGAAGLAASWKGDAFAELFVTTGREGFFYPLAALYYVFGAHQVVGLVLNASMSAMLVPVLYDTTRRLFGHEPARIAALLVVVLPGFLVWTSQLLREVQVVFFLALAANAIVRLSEKKSSGAWLVVSLCVAALFTLRGQVAVVAAAAFLVAIIAARPRLMAGLTTSAATLIVIGLLVLSGGIGYAGYRATQGADLERVSVTRQFLADAESGISPDTDISTPSKALVFLPYAMSSFLLGPYPWQIHNPRQIGLLLEAAALWLLLPSLVRGYRRAKVDIGRGRFMLLIPAMLIAVTLSLLIGNFGTIVRERLQVEVFLVPFAAYGWCLRRRIGTTDEAAPVSALSRV